MPISEVKYCQMTEPIALFDKYHFVERKEKLAFSFSEIEEKIGFIMPADYKYFLENYCSFEGFVGNEFIRLWNYEELTENNDAPSCYFSIN